MSESNRRRYLSPAEGTPYPLEYAYHLLPDIGGKKVLDYGCGAGENTVALALRGASVTGLDISPELLEIASKRARANQITANFVVASAVETGLPNEEFDVVFGAAILHHLEIAAASGEVFRLLKPGGCAIFVEPVRESRLAHWYRRVMPATGEDISPDEYPLRERDIFTFCDGLALTECKPFALPHVKLGNRKWLWKADRYFLDHCPWLLDFARIRVFRYLKRN